VLVAIRELVTRQHSDDESSGLGCAMRGRFHDAILSTTDYDVALPRDLCTNVIR
jgi:hypothetical protein